MNGRAFIAGIAAFLLPLPFIVLFGALRHHAPQEEHLMGRRISPVLDVESRTRLVTFHRNCDQDADCEPPLGCVVDGRVWVTYCSDSQCVTDAQCPDGLVCRSVASMGEGPLVRFCITEGIREAGHRCDDLPSHAQEACGPGLLCGGKQGWCGHPCGDDVRANCPEGFFCADVAPRPLCLPTCESRGCPEGEQCLRYEDGVSQCAKVYGRNCQQSSCGEGETCKILNSVDAPGKVWIDCVRSCGEGRPECPEGMSCHLFLCQKNCDPNDSGACGEGLRCMQTRPGRPWYCRADW